MDKKAKIVWKPLSELVPYEHNAKEHTPTQLKNIATSLEKYGWQNPLLITRDNVIVAGHGRVMAARIAGLDEAPCIYAEGMTDEQIKEYRHLDNLLAEGDYLLDEFKIDMPDLSDFDFSEIDVELFNEPIEFDESLLDELFTDAPNPDKEPKKVQCPHCKEWFEV